MSFPPLNEQMDAIRRGTAEIIPEDHLVQKIEKSLKTNKPLNVKLGCDPSKPDLHLGHSVVLRKLRQFQDLGHQATLIVGDFTGMIGDPSGRSKTRPHLTLEETRKNGQSYFEQATKILSTKKIQMLYNSEWLGNMSFSDVIRLASKYTVARMLERDDFERRYKSGEPISIHEFLYPLAQAMDSVAVEADIELGGTDQKFNLLVGRDIQREYGLEPQVAITLPILRGTDGVEKMSKTLDNCIGISDSPKEIYGRTLSIPDKLIYDYYVLTTDLPLADLRKINEQLNSPSTNPRDLKRRLARELVRMYHNSEAANRAEDEFDRVHIRKAQPEEIPEVDIAMEDGKISIIRLLTETRLATSNSDARRLIDQGGVSVDGRRITDPNSLIELTVSVVLQVGKRHFVRVGKAPRGAKK
ncbi:MAG: tyrosine--tRNA ligase [Ignavibacteriae bacterium]|nr:tyrosine--tRNA ligase [Ignavibacteriota bacterium]